jgi:hypothetical protein
LRILYAGTRGVNLGEAIKMEINRPIYGRVDAVHSVYRERRSLLQQASESRTLRSRRSWWLPHHSFL